jgi:hypothetical protein
MLIPSSWLGVDTSLALAAVVITVYACVCSVYDHQQDQPPDLLTEHRYDVRRLLAGLKDYLAALVFDAQGCWGPITFVIEHPINRAEP